MDWSGCLGGSGFSSFTLSYTARYQGKHGYSPDDIVGDGMLGGDVSSAAESWTMVNNPMRTTANDFLERVSITLVCIRFVFQTATLAATAIA